MMLVCVVTIAWQLVMRPLDRMLLSVQNKHQCPGLRYRRGFNNVNKWRVYAGDI